MNLSHEAVTFLDAISRIVEAIAVVVAAIYARHGARIAKRTAKALGTLPVSWWRRHRAGKNTLVPDRQLVRLKDEKDQALAIYLDAARKVTDYTGDTIHTDYTVTPPNGRHKPDE